MSSLPPPTPPLAYLNAEFLATDDARPLRILAEYLAPLQSFRRARICDTVVFFGSARFASHSDAHSALEVLKKPGSLAPAPPEEQEKVQRAHAALEMARYYEEARALAHRLTQWALKIPSRRRRFVVTTGGGPGIMEAANRGAREAGGKTIGLNINLPYEQTPNPYISPELNLEFHYFFMRKLWFAYLAKALIVFPGGFGTCDELFEILTLAQTEKLAKKILVVMYGSEYWNRVFNLKAMIDAGTISAKDVNLFKMVDSVDEAFAYLQEGLTKYHLNPPYPDKERGPEIARTR
ncbi:MAG: LOG family protein [Terriglobales bacterium]